MAELDRNEVRRLMGKAYGEWYWLDRGRRQAKEGKPAMFPKATQEDIVGAILRYRKYRTMLTTAPAETNDRGNHIYRGIDADERVGIHNTNRDRYIYDAGLGRDWQQFDTRQDAWYFGVWINGIERKTFTYCEGDRTLVECPTPEGFRAELASMEDFYGPPPPAVVACSDIGYRDGRIVPAGNVECYYSERPRAI